ncbi:MAG: hypothetical protein AAF682_08780 [Planctomycetota bacterium]
MKLLPALGAGSVVVLSAVDHAQTLYVLDGPAAIVREASGPPAGPCGYPDGAVFSEFPTTGGFACPLPGRAQPQDLFGDVAVDRFNDVIWVTDGFRVASYQGDDDPVLGVLLGTPLNSFDPSLVLTEPILGMGFDGQKGTLWLTDGQQAVEVRPPVIPCNPPAIVTAPFLLPQLGGPSNKITDIDWDPLTLSLWTCSESGFVGNVLPGVPVGSIGPLGVYLAVPGLCNLELPLTGVSVDASSPVAGSVFVSDAQRVANLVPGGQLAPDTFAKPSKCYPVPSGSSSGVGYSSRPVTYGVGGSAAGTQPPKMGSVGQAVIGSSKLSITVDGAPGGAIAFLPFSLDPLCPALSILMAPLIITPPGIGLFTTAINAVGSGSIALPIPPTTPLGLEYHYQWFITGGSGGPSPDGPPILSSGAGTMRPGFR